MSKTCPVCTKPLFYAPYAPEDTAKQACSDLNCVNAHGIVQHLPLDMWDKVPVQYSETPTPTKGHTMSDLIIAKSRAADLKRAQEQIDTFLAPFVKDFAAFMAKENARGFDLRDFEADTFTEIDGGTFHLTGEEQYSFGDYYTPSLNLPFAFVEDPAAYKANFLKEQAEIEAKKNAKIKADKTAQIARLKAQLARAEEELAKADAQKDPIRTIATRNKEQKLISELAKTLDQV